MIGAILAGGHASRFGGGDKGFARVGGRPILEHVASVLRAGCGIVVINANGAPERFAGLGLPVVADSVRDRPGPLAGVLAVLDWTAAHHSDVSHVVTAPGDTPFLPPDLVARLAAEHRGATVVVARSGGRRHPVAALWPVALRADLRRAMLDEGVRRVGLFLERCPLAHVDWASDPVDPFFNVNTAADLAKADSIVAQSLTRPRGGAA